MLFLELGTSVYTVWLSPNRYPWPTLQKGAKTLVGWQKISSEHVLIVFSGRTKFWDAHTIRKWTRHLHTKTWQCVPMTRKRNKWHVSKAPLPPGSLDDSAKMFFENDMCFPFTILTYLLWLFAQYVAWDVLRLSSTFCIHCTSPLWFWV